MRKFTVEGGVCIRQNRALVEVSFAEDSGGLLVNDHDDGNPYMPF